MRDAEAGGTSALTLILPPPGRICEGLVHF
jgi:hypothetical protein